MRSSTHARLSTGGAVVISRCFFVQSLFAAVFLILAATSAACAQQGKTGQNTASVAESTSASLTVVQPSGPVHADTSKISVVLRNEGHSSFWVNKRGFSGYYGKPSPLRELSMEVRDSAGKSVEFYCFDKSRMAQKSDYVLLAPGGSLNFKLGLFCFKFTGPGEYRIIVHYQDSNTDPTVAPGSPVLVKELVSAPATIQLVE